MNERKFDFFFTPPTKEQESHVAKLRRRDLIICELKAGSNTVNGWREAWEDQIKAKEDQTNEEKKGENEGTFHEAMTSLDIIRDKDASFSSWADRYVWMKIVIAYLLVVSSQKDQKFVEKCLERMDPQFFEEGLKDTPQDPSLREALLEDMLAVGELYVLRQIHLKPEHPDPLQVWGLAFIKANLRSSDVERHPSHLVQLYATGLVLAENTQDLTTFTQKLFQMDDLQIKPLEKRDLLHWTVEKVNQLDEAFDRPPKQAVKPSKALSPNDDADQRPEHHPALIHIISDQYLRHYDIENAFTFWEKLKDSPSALWVLLRIFAGNHPSILFGVFLVTLVLLEIEMSLGKDAAMATIIMAVTVAGALMMLLLWFAFDFIRRKGYAFGHLLWQRLIGASILGLSVIALTPEGWQIGLFSPWGNWALVTLGGFSLAWFFLFFKIYQERARTGYSFESAREKSGGADREKPQTLISQAVIFLGRQLRREHRQYFKKDIFRISWKVLVIHAFLTLIITFLVSGSLFHIFQNTDPIADSVYKINQSPTSWVFKGIKHGAVNNDEIVIAVTLEKAPYLSFGFSPKLILLWSSISILLGAFVQLLWDETLLAGA